MENVKVNKNVSVRTRNLVTSALLAAIICLVTGYILHIPTPNGGYAHIGDTFIYLAAVLLPKPYAALAAAVGAGMADVLTGAANWAFATIIIKPILVLFFTNKSDKIINVRNVFAAIIAGIVGTVLYMVAEGIMYGSFVAAFALSLVGLIQPIGSFIVFIVLGLVFDKIKIKEIIK